MSLPEKTAQRVVANGRVYRQKFEAEVQLVNSLEAAHQRRECTLPEIHPCHGTLMSGMLTSRQKSWTTEFPNEPNTENPVVYKYYADEYKKCMTESATTLESKEVRGLPDVIVPTKVGSNILERTSQDRQNRHEAALEDMRHELCVISSELEPQIVSASEKLIAMLIENEVVVNNIMAKLENEENMTGCSYGELLSIWDQVAAETARRLGWIKQLDDTLSKLEDHRVYTVRKVFEKYAPIIEKIAHVLPIDMHKQLDKESQLINQIVLSNRRAYADLYARLTMTEIEQEKRRHDSWTEHAYKWKQSYINDVLMRFRNYMVSDEVKKARGLMYIRENLVEDLRRLNLIRIDLINTLRPFTPVGCPLVAVDIYEWNQMMTDVSRQMDDVRQNFFCKLISEYEMIFAHCRKQAEHIQAELAQCGVFTAAKAKELVSQDCFPLILEHQNEGEKVLEQMDKNLEDQSLLTLHRIKCLGRYVQGIVHHWKQHELGLGKQEKALQEKLDKCRETHDTQNEEREASLDTILDQMRQQCSEQALRNDLQNAQHILDSIKQGYQEFQKQQMIIVAAYPEMVQSELDYYEDQICTYLSISLKHPDQYIAQLEGEAFVEEEESPVSRHSREKKSPSSTKTSPDPTVTKTTPEDGKHSSFIVEVMTSEHGTTFYKVNAEYFARRYQLEKAPRKTTSSRKGGGSVKSSTSTSTANAPVRTPRPNELAVPGANPVQETETAIWDVNARLHTTASGDDVVLDSTQSSEEVVLPTEDPVTKLDYIKNVIIKESLFNEVKKDILMNVINHLEKWLDSANKQSCTVVNAKMEEMNNELELRLHLHQPRTRRVELDIHNVRAAELVLHSERVARHTGSIMQGLVELKQKFDALKVSQDQRTDIYQKDMAKMEVLFSTADKTTKLEQVFVRVRSEQAKFVDSIRSEMLNFRKLLDSTLQTYRQSNARFISSFKLFADGGNFCTSEVNDFRKTLDQLNPKMNQCESAIISPMEVLESKRIEQINKITTDFEERFQVNAVDLAFSESMARSLSAIQLKVKTEVAECNTQALNICRFLDDLERQSDACAKPHPDKEVVAPDMLKDSLIPIYEAVNKRCLYLNCLREELMKQTSSTGTMQGNPALGARLLAPGCELNVSKAGKSPGDDTSINTIKHIMMSQRSKQSIDDDSTSIGGSQQDSNTSNLSKKMTSNTGANSGKKKKVPTATLR